MVPIPYPGEMDFLIFAARANQAIFPHWGKYPGSELASPFVDQIFFSRKENQSNQTRSQWMKAR